MCDASLLSTLLSSHHQICGNHFLTYGSFVIATFQDANRIGRILKHGILQFAKYDSEKDKIIPLPTSILFANVREWINTIYAQYHNTSTKEDDWNDDIWTYVYPCVIFGDMFYKHHESLSSLMTYSLDDNKVI